MKNSIGIDIGGTITKIGIVSSEGKCLKKTSFRTKEFNSFDDYIVKLTNTIDELISEHQNIIGIGIGAPNASKKWYY